MSTNDEHSIIEKEFSASWDRPEDFFGRFNQTKVCDLIADLKERGYNKQLRAGTSVARFILSRSRKWGLRREQPRLMITGNGKGGMRMEYREGDYWSETESENFEFTPELQAMLDKLLEHPID